MPQGSFSTPEHVSLERVIELNVTPTASNPEELEDKYEIQRCADWVKTSGFQKVCLQFPDKLLPDSSEIALRLEKILNQTVYILGDTAYESCCIDYIAAAHIDADAIIHFGPTCFSKSTGIIPFLYIYEKYPLDVDKLKLEIAQQTKEANDIVLLVDTPYIHRIDDIRDAFKEESGITIPPLDKALNNICQSKVLFVGKDERKLMNLEFMLQPKELYYFDETLKRHETSLRVLKKRNYLVEKIKDSSTIGIVIGTLGIKNYLKIIDRLKKLITLNGKKYYLISIGKPTVAKLANFPELDVYVVVTCSQSEIYESREFYKPIATPYDVEIALNSNRDETLKFSYDFNHYLGSDFENENLTASVSGDGDVSLLTNKVRAVESDDFSGGIPQQSNQVAIRSDGTLSLNTRYGAGYLADRTWKGLEQNLGQTEVELAEEGRSGLAQKYTNEVI